MFSQQKTCPGRASWRNRLPGRRLTVKLQNILCIELTFRAVGGVSDVSDVGGGVGGAVVIAMSIR